jgi:hypothetical protein
MLEKLYTLEVPEWAVSAIESGDDLGLTEDEIRLVERFVASCSSTAMTGNGGRNRLHAPK